MKDIKALACVNMYAVLGAIPTLCLLSDEAKTIIGNEKIAIGFSVKGGPSATLRFADGKCTMENGTKKCNIKLPFSSHKRFCDMIDGKASAFPSKGFLRIGFLLKKFIPLTDLLSKYLPHGLPCGFYRR